MHVIATAGHVDHGKSTLVRALTGMEPDRWAEEQRRGMTIDLGYAWMALSSGVDLAFVDVPGHERFTTNMLAGVGPVPAALVVVAADGGWSAQTAEHVAALDALGVSHAVVAVTRSDLADPGPVIDDVRRRLTATSLGPVEAVAVSGRTGTGLGDLVAALERLVQRLPPPDTAARVRLWIDRAFTVRGFGTVLTGTLGAGRIAAGDTLELGDESVVVRGLESLGRRAEAVGAVARVAVNLRAVPHQAVRRGQVLQTPGAWLWTDRVDVRIHPREPLRLPRELVLHIGSTAVAVGVRTLDPSHLRLTLRTPLPLQIGDRALLRDPGLRQVLTGLVVLDPDPPSLAGRGAARARLGQLAGATGHADLGGEVDRRRVVRRAVLAKLGVPAGPTRSDIVEAAGWVVAADRWRDWCQVLAALVERADIRDERLVGSGLARTDAARGLDLPDPALLAPIVASCPGLELVDGQVRRRGQAPVLNAGVAAALQPLLDRLSVAPFEAPAAGDLLAAGLGPRQVAAAATAGVVLRLPGDVILLPDAPQRAAEVLAGLPQPFTLSAARQALATSRRVAVPLLEYLDRVGLTRRVDESHRALVAGARSR